MKTERNVPSSTNVTLGRIKEEYVNLLKLKTFSLKQLFESERARFDEFCIDFGPHPQSNELKIIVEEYGRSNGIWLKNASHHVTCALYLYPTGEFERMVTMMKNLILGFYLNDTMGRDIFKSLSVEKQEESRKIIENMAGLNSKLQIDGKAHHLERINAEILNEFRNNSPKTWFETFFRDYCYHINVTHQDGNADTLGHIPTLNEYIQLRCHYAGVHHIIRWIEYNRAQFLDWYALDVAQMSSKMNRLHSTVAAFEALSNDLFSFEKEVIDCDADSNLVMILAMNEPGLHLQEAILKAGEIVRNLLAEACTLIEKVRQEVRIIAFTAPKLAQNLNFHLDGIARCIKAGWVWHCHSARYKRVSSLWDETKVNIESSLSRS